MQAVREVSLAFLALPNVYETEWGGGIRHRAQCCAQCCAPFILFFLLTCLINCTKP